MALITCSECGKQISDKAAVCVGCGAPLSAAPPSNGQSTNPKKKGKAKAEQYAEEEVAIFVKTFQAGGSIRSIAAALSKEDRYVGEMAISLLLKKRIDRIPIALTDQELQQKMRKDWMQQRAAPSSSVNPAIICPHCQTKGQVSATQGTSVTKISGGFFGDLISGTKRTQTRTVTNLHCINCGTRWEVA